MSRFLIGLALFGLLAGCASSQGASRHNGEPCVPATVAAPSTWTHPISQDVLLIGTDGKPIAGRRVQYDTPGGKIQVWWVGGYVVAIDPAVSNPTVPALYDAGLATGEGTVITGGTPSCHWKPLGSVGA